MESTQEQHTATSKKSLKTFLTGLTLFLSLSIAVLAIGYSYFQTQKLNRDIHQKTEPLLQDQGATKAELEALKETENKLNESLEAHRQRLDILEAEPSFFSLVPAEKRLLWQLAEATYLVRIAHHKLWYEQDIETAELLLKEVDELILNTQNTSLHFIHQEVENKQSEIKKFKEEQVNPLPLIEATIHQIELLPEQSFRISATIPSSSSKPPEENLPQWKQVLSNWWNFLKSSIQIRKRDSKGVAEPTFEMAVLTMINRLEQSKMAVWRKDDASYQNQIAKLEEWLQKNFSKEDPQVTSILERVVELKGMTIKKEVPEIDSIAKLLTTALENQQKGNASPNSG